MDQTAAHKGWLQLKLSDQFIVILMRANPESNDFIIIFDG